MCDFIFMDDLRQIFSHMIGNVTYIRAWDRLRTVTTFFHFIKEGGKKIVKLRPFAYVKMGLYVHLVQPW